MKYSVQGRHIVAEIPDFDIEATLFCGQCFRWKKYGNGCYAGIAGGKYLKISPGEKFSTYVFHNVNLEEFEDFWVKYFDLDRDYLQIKKSLFGKNLQLNRAISHAPGIRILRQDPWETLCSFIISQNNNIPRISGIVENLCEMFGEEFSPGQFFFPSAKTVARLTGADLAPLRCGFRAPYILDAAQNVASGAVNFEILRTLPIEKSRLELMKIRGVGPKVAECTLLYGLHRLEAFPIDVWMKRAMAILFPGLTSEFFGKYAGVAQQYIFHYVRSAPEILSAD